MKDSLEGKKRMDLRQAANALSLSPNGVRSRFKRGFLDGERDNKGKIWVYIEPSNEDYNTGFKKVTKNASENPDSKQLSAIVQRLSDDLRQARIEHREERERLTLEVEQLRSKLDAEREKRHAAEIRASEGFFAKMIRLVRGA